MNWDQVKGNWKQMQGEAQKQWGKLTNDDLDADRGRAHQAGRPAAGALRLRKEKADAEIDNWMQKH